MPMVRAAALRYALRPAAVMSGVGAVGSFGSEIHDLRGKLPVHEERVYATREIDIIKGVVFHHTATSGVTLNRIALSHIRDRNWPGIAYHIAIGWDGKIYLLHDLTTISFHTANHNRRNVGIALIGNYHQRDLTPEMKASILKVLSWLGEQVEVEYIWLHRDTKPTACPGDYAVEYLRPLQFGPKP